MTEVKLIKSVIRWNNFVTWANPIVFQDFSFLFCKARMIILPITSKGFFWGGRPHPVTGGTLVPQASIKPTPPCNGRQSLNHWTAREIPQKVAWKIISSQTIGMIDIILEVFTHYLLSTALNTCRLSYFGHVQLFVTLWTVTLQAPLSMGFSRQEHWSGLPCPSSADLPNPGIEPTSLMSPALAGSFFTTSVTSKYLESG